MPITSLARLVIEFGEQSTEILGSVLLLLRCGQSHGMGFDEGFQALHQTRD